MKSFVRHNIFSHLWDCEKHDPRKDYESHGVEPAADVGQKPKDEGQLDWVDPILDQEETLQLDRGAVQLGGHRFWGLPHPLIR